jgi:uncharacterized cupin superfamily protein
MGETMAKKIDLNNVSRQVGSGYPAPFDALCAKRLRHRLGDAANLTDFGVNLMRLAPGTWSSQRHWHTHEDEFVYVLEGQVVLVTDEGEEILEAGDSAGFKAGVADGHHLQNRSGQDALLLEIGSRRESEDETDYPGIDLQLPKSGHFVRRDGTRYPRR